jgi:hypothetical protein
LGSRSRKRSRATGPGHRVAAPADAPVPATTKPGTPGPLDEFSAVAEPPPRPAPRTAPEAVVPAKPKKLRGEAANEAVRAGLRPLEAKERPPALLVAVGVTLLLGLGNLVSFLLGFEVDGKRPPASGVISFASIMFIMAWGMWTKRYWAILGFQALLALIVIVFALFLPTASNLQAVGVCVVIVGFGGWLFWKLVRVMSRVQMPARPGR